MYRYLTVRSDPLYGAAIASPELIGLLVTMPELRQVGPASFEAAAGMPWLSLVVAHADPAGGYVVGGSPPRLVNVLELVCCDDEGITCYDGLAGRIAASLRWEAVEEKADRCIRPANPASPGQGSELDTGLASGKSAARLRAGSPRLADPAQAADFAMEIIEEPRDVGL